jgi:hypothetical protein
MNRSQTHNITVHAGSNVRRKQSSVGGVRLGRGSRR